MNYELRYEIQGTAQQWVDSFMAQYNISATDMVDALNSVLVGLKDKAVREMLVQIYQTKTTSSQEHLENKEEVTTNGESDI